MIGIVIVAHGGLAAEYLAAVEHVVGKQDGMIAVTITADHDRETKQAEICAAVDSVDTGAGVAVVTDMFGGSPSNLSLKACNECGRRVLYGANLPLLVKLAKSRHKPIDAAVDAAIRDGRKYLDCLPALA
ncbi:MAG: PTS sugar transporter subunit IIA [Planktomarina sp.]